MSANIGMGKICALICEFFCAFICGICGRKTHRKSAVFLRDLRGNATGDFFKR